MSVAVVNKIHWVASCDFCGKELKGGAVSQWDTMPEMASVMDGAGWVHEGAMPEKGHHLMCDECIPS